jgi:hypothetical protein
VITSPPALSELGVCMGEDTLRPTMAISKEIDLRFVFGDTTRIPGRAVPVGRRQAGRLAVDHRHGGTRRCRNRFEALGDPETHAKILIDPTSAALVP